MKETQNTKLISDLNINGNRLRAHRPFKVSSENHRSFVRLEIMSPMSIYRVKDIFGHYWTENDKEQLPGIILNISATGVLVELTERLNEGDIVSMSFTLQGVEEIGNVLGIVKRTDDEEDYQLVGIEFTKKEKLSDSLTGAELEMLGDDFNNFQETVQDVLRKYVYTTSEVC
ncbi:MAG: PilZ domain-containing protein [bacterium]|nr:PilZ domain-containing protein [bacterium]